MTLSLVLAVGIAMAQTSMKEVRSVTFYGVDFTKAKVVGAEYRATDMIRAFGNTNQAFMNEPNRFNVAKALKVAIERMQLTTVRERNLAIPYDALSTVEVAEALSEEQVAEVVAAYPEGRGYGALILGEEINGATSQVRLRMVDCGLEWCRGSIPVGDEQMDIEWQCADGEFRVKATLPQGYSCEVVPTDCKVIFVE